MKTCLLIIFNSPFAANIPLLEALYRSRFDRVVFVLTEDARRPDAIRVHGESKTFHNFLLQAFDDVQGYDYYIVTHDDAILTPRLIPSRLFTDFGVPLDAICLRDISVVPRHSTWHWATHGGYDVVDSFPEVRELLSKVHPILCERYLSIIPQGPRQAIAKLMEQQLPPMLFGGGPNADLIFAPGHAFEELMDKIRILNQPELFVELVVPMAALLTRCPVYLLSAGRHCPIHRPFPLSSRLPVALRLAFLIASNRLSYHPIKFGGVGELSKRNFVRLYRMFNKTVSN